MMNNNSSSWVLFSLSIAVGVTMMGLGIIWPLVPVYAVELGAGGLMVGLIIASYNVSRVLFSPFTGRLSDRRGRKMFIVYGLFTYAGVSVLYVVSKSPEALIFVRLLHGLASLLVVPIAMALAADIAPESQLGEYMGTLNMAVMVGIGFGPLMGGTIRDYLGTNAPFYAMGSIALLTCLLVIKYIPSDTKKTGHREKLDPYPVKKILSNKVMRGIFIMRFFAASGQGAVYTFLPILALQLDLSGTQVGIILTMNIIFIAILQRPCGRIADMVNPKFLVIIGTFASGMTVFGMPLVDGFVFILGLNIFMGMANGISLPGGMVITGRLGQTMGMASTMSLNDAAWSLGMIVSPIISGIILDTVGLSFVFIIGSLLILTGGVAVTVYLWGYEHKIL